jgi:hypothetical protein
MPTCSVSPDPGCSGIAETPSMLQKKGAESNAAADRQIQVANVVQMLDGDRKGVQRTIMGPRLQRSSCDILQRIRKSIEG